MKRTFKSFSQTIASILLFSFLFISCEKIDSDLVGEWHLNKANFLITANQDFVFHDLFGKFWQGTISINNEEFDPESFSYHAYNIGPFELGSNDLQFAFLGPQLEIMLRGERYMLDSYEFDILSGIFKADGMAKGNDHSIHVKVNTTMPKIEVRRGERITVKDGYRNMPYMNIWFKDGGELQIDYLIEDIMDILSGKWNVKNNRITLSLKEHKDDTYQYNYNGNELILTKDNISKEDLPSHLAPYAEKISNTTFVATYRIR